MAARSQHGASGSPRKRRSGRRWWGLVGVAALTLLAVFYGRPALVWWEVNRAQRALAERDPETAIAALELALVMEPDRAETHFWLARAHRLRGAMDEVRGHIEQAWQLGFPTERLEREQFLAMAQSGQMRTADPHLPDLLINPGDDGREICEAYVNGYFLTCRFAEAFRLLDVWEAEFPDDAQPCNFRAMYAISIGDMRSGAEYCRSGLERDPDRMDLQLALATCLTGLHEFEEAERVLRDLLERNPENIGALGTLAECRLEQGDADAAEEYLTRLLSLDPDNIHGNLTRARSYAFSQRADEAVALSERIVRERPYDVEARFVLATALRAAGRRDESESEFEFVRHAREELAHARLLRQSVIEQDPSNVEWRYEVGRILLKYESPEMGAGWLRSVLEIVPGHQATHRALADYYESIGKSELAAYHRERVTSPAAEDH